MIMNSFSDYTLQFSLTVIFLLLTLFSLLFSLITALLLFINSKNNQKKKMILMILKISLITLVVNMFLLSASYYWLNSVFVPAYDEGSIMEIVNY
jgi:hypothetical protein